MHLDRRRHSRAFRPAAANSWRCAAVLSAAACASRPPAPAVGDGLYGQPIDAAEFPEAERLTNGFAPLADERGILAGDTFFYGIRVQEHEEVKRLYLRVQALASLEPKTGSLLQTDDTAAAGMAVLTLTPSEGPKRSYASRLVAAVVEVREGDTPADAVSVSQLPGDFLARGLADLLATWPPQLPDESAEEYGRRLSREPDIQSRFELGFVTLMSALQLVQGQPKLNDLLLELVSAGDKLRALFGGIGIEPDFGSCQREERTPGEPTWSFPLTITAGGRPAVYVKFVVGTSRGPWALVGGVRELTAVSASDPRVTLRMVALASRREGLERRD